MARIARSSTLETREARSRLKQRHAAYWKKIHKGLACGYRKGPAGGSWIIRRAAGDSYTFETVGAADDFAEANGADVLSYAQATRKAFDESDKKADPSGYTVKQAMQDYADYIKAKKKSGFTVEKTVNAHILPAFGDRKVESVTKDEIERWHDRLSKSPKHLRGKDKPKLVEPDDHPETIRRRRNTANRILGVFKAGLNRAKKNKKVKTNPWNDVEPFRGVNGARKIFLQEDQCRRLINVCSGRLREYVQALLYTGARPGKELEHIRVQDFDLEAGTLHIPDGKTGPRDIFLTSEGVRFFSQITAGRKPDETMLLKDDGTVWGKNHYSRDFKRAVRKAKLPAATNAYALRHSYISLALKNGMNLQVLAESTGTSIKMLEEHYGKYLHADRRKMFERALPSFGFKADNKVRRIA